MPSATDSAASAASSTLRITLRPSRRLAGYLFSIHLLAGFALFFTRLPGWGIALLTVVLALNLLRSLRQHYYWNGERELIYQDGNWRLLEGEGHHDLELAGESYIHPWLTILRFRTRVLPILPDSAEPAQLRELRRTLRFGLESVDLSRR